LCNIQQQQAYLLQQQNVQATEEDPCLRFKTDPRFLSWIGASILPKLDSAKDMFIHKDKFQSKFTNYREQFIDLKNK
jgi:actin-related protein